MPALPKIEQLVYSCVRGSIHFQDLDRELRDLAAFLSAHGVAATTAVDVGCGDGRVTERLHHVLGLREIHGFEVNARLVDRARQRGLSVTRADATALVVRSRFDLAISYGALHHFAEPGRLLTTLARLSRRHVVVVDSTVRRHLLHRITGSAYFPLEASPYRIRSVDDVAAAMATAGLRVIARHTNENANIWHDRSFLLGEHPAPGTD
jgi:2-polyprenyl-3-methyl-5-hydroxy-6-metoxy-1,4-benzoquinol methylase